MPYGCDVAWVAGMVENLPIVESFNGVKISQYKVSVGLLLFGQVLYFRDSHAVAQNDDENIAFVLACSQF